jgi:hypothetical protein
MKAAWLVALAACGGDPCDGVGSTCIAVRVTSQSISSIDTLELDISYTGFHATATSTSGATELPLVTAVELTDATDEVTVEIVAAGKLAGAVLGTGYQRTDPIAADAHATLTIPIAALAEMCKLGTYCGGDKVDGDPDTLYLCHPGGASDPDGTPEADVPTARGHCANGCIQNTADDDVCAGGNIPCVAGNDYCGGHDVDGDPQVLYRCDSTGKGVFVSDCAAAGKQCGALNATSDGCR